MFKYFATFAEEEKNGSVSEIEEMIN